MHVMCKKCYCEVYTHTHLKRAQAELEEVASILSRVLWQKGKHHVMHAKQRDQEKSRFGQSPKSIEIEHYYTNT